MVSDIKDKDTREILKNHDALTYRSGGLFIENTVKNLLSNPENISIKLNKELFDRLLSKLFIETNIPYKRKLENGSNRNDKRRNIRFFEKTIMFYYYKEKIPVNMLDCEFSIEHIIPNSSDWEEELDKDRTGNLIPILSCMNSSRGNKHINIYKKNVEGKNFCDFIKDIIPNEEIYDSIIHYDKKPIIKNNKLYNDMCEKNEAIYKEKFIECLFK